MKLDKIKLTDLKPSDYNPRVISDENFQKLKASLGNYGLVDPIVINLKNNNTIIGGHQRYKALLEDTTLQDLYLLKLGDIGWVFDTLDLKVDDEETEKLLNITLNQNNMMGSWDNSKLESIFTSLELAEIDLSWTGFDDWEIEEISLSTGTTIFDYTDEPETPPIPEKTTTPTEKPTPKTDDKDEKTSSTSNPPENHEPDIPLEEPTIDESIADNIETIKCPNCGYEIPKK